MQTKFVAEVASNHNGNLDRALQMIEDAKYAGCWGVKFQLFELDKLFAPEALLDKPELEARRSWELPRNFIPTLKYAAGRKGLAFGCTPFDLGAVDFLYPYVDFYKIASYNLLDYKLLRMVAAQQKQIVLSTGAATLAEIEAAISIIRDVDRRANLTVLHCVSAYPAPIESCNLGMISRIREFKVKSGWSDHSVSPAVIYRAIHRYNADMIEFHFDDESCTGVDSGTHSWTPQEIKRVIDTIKLGEKADNGLPKFEYVEPAEEKERMWRADPSDGLRPIVSERIKIKLKHEANQ